MAPLSKLLPFILLLVLLGIATFLAYAIYTIVSDVASKTQKKMEEKNVSFSKEGMKVGVREVQNENYVDQTQSLLVKAWSYSSWPAYKNSFWNKEQQQPAARNPYSNSGSST